MESKDEATINAATDAIADAAASLAKTKTGALIVFERKSGLGDILTGGTVLNADISSEVLENIFN